MNLPEFRDCLWSFKVNYHRPGEVKEYINHGEQVPHSAVLPSVVLHIGQVGLPLNIDFPQICVVNKNRRRADLCSSSLGITGLSGVWNYENNAA